MPIAEINNTSNGTPTTVEKPLTAPGKSLSIPT